MKVAPQQCNKKTLFLGQSNDTLTFTKNNFWNLQFKKNKQTSANVYGRCYTLF